LRDLRPAIAVLAWLAGAGSAHAQGRPFVFSVTTAPPSTSDRWTAQYDVGTADRTADPFGYDGLEQRARIQGALGAGFTVIGEVGLGIDEQNTNTTQQIEALKDVLGTGRTLQLAGGLGVRREWEGTSVLLGRVVMGHAFRRSSLFGNLLFEKPLASDRDSVDLITSLGWLHRVGGSLRVGVEAIGEDLEGFWEAEEAEGGAKLFVGPSIQLAPPQKPIYASLCGGPVWYATQSSRTSPAVRPLGATGNGYTVRFSVGYRF